MTQFMQKYNYTNITAVIIPHRHDLTKDSRTNLEIQAFNAKLSKIAKSFRHVALVEMDPKRKYFTKHDLHLNKAGKELFAKLIVNQINKLMNSICRNEPAIALNWKEETTNKSTNVNDNLMPKLLTADGRLLEVLIPPTHVYNNQGNTAENESLRRTSYRQKEAPLTRSKDFLWQVQS
jgi:hypothetical protein